MCITPCRLADGSLVACRFCWQCENNRVNDLVGRCIAEQQYSLQTFSVTLTYREDHPSAVILNYKDVQDFLKRLRRKMGVVRYIVAGEYGSKKGRAHWHIVLFFKSKELKRSYNPDDKDPWDYTLNQRIDWKPWPHGFVYFQRPDYGGFAYAMKYALKDQAMQASSGHLAMSKKPPLGAQFFEELAQRYVDQAIAPKHLFYSFPEVLDNKRRPREFMIQGKTRENFFSSFQSKWEAQRPDQEMPWSDCFDEYQDQVAREENSEFFDQRDFRLKKDVIQYRDYDDDLNFCDERTNFISGTYSGSRFVGVEVVTERQVYRPRYKDGGFVRDDQGEIIMDEILRYDYWAVIYTEWGKTCLTEEDQTLAKILRRGSIVERREVLKPENEKEITDFRFQHVERAHAEDLWKKHKTSKSSTMKPAHLARPEAPDWIRKRQKSRR